MDSIGTALGRDAVRYFALRILASGRSGGRGEHQGGNNCEDGALHFGRIERLFQTVNMSCVEQIKIIVETDICSTIYVESSYRASVYLYTQYQPTPSPLWRPCASRNIGIEAFPWPLSIGNSQLMIKLRLLGKNRGGHGLQTDYD